VTRLLRFDAGTLQSARRTSQGYLRVDGWASRVGIQEYRNPDGSIRRELREPDAVFSNESLLGFEGAPITDDHPDEMVDLHNAKTLTKGHVLSVGRKDGDHVAVSMVVTDPALIAKMESGKRQLSTGYYVELDETPGVHPTFGRYDAKQVRVGPVNHLAVVERGRAGTARVRMDAAMDVELGGTEVASDLTDASRVPHSDSVMDLEAALAKIKELEAQLAALKSGGDGDGDEGRTDAADKARLEGERDAARKDAEDAKALVEQTKKDAAELVTKTVRESLDVLSKATAVLGADAKITIKKDDADVEVALVDAPLRAVKCAVVKKVDSRDIAADKHDAYVEALFENALDNHAKRQDAAAKGADSLAAARAAAGTPLTAPVETETKREDTAVDAERAAAEQNKARLANAWQSTETK